MADYWKVPTNRLPALCHVQHTKPDDRNEHDQGPEDWRPVISAAKDKGAGTIERLEQRDGLRVRQVTEYGQPCEKQEKRGQRN